MTVPGLLLSVYKKVTLLDDSFLDSVLGWISFKSIAFLADLY